MKGFIKNLRGFRILLAVMLAAILFVPDSVEAAVSVTIAKGSTKTQSVAAAGNTITVNLTGASNPVLRGKPSWISVSGRTVTVSKNTSASSRSGDVVFQNGNSGPTYTLRVTQAAAQTVNVKFNNNCIFR